MMQVKRTSSRKNQFQARKANALEEGIFTNKDTNKHFILPVFVQNLRAAEFLLQTPTLSNICHLQSPGQMVHKLEFTT